MKGTQEARWLISDLQTVDICERSRLCESPHYLTFITRELCADAVFLQFLCLAGSAHSPKYDQPPLIFLESTVLRSLSVRMVLTVKSAKFRFFPQISCHFLFLYLELLVTGASPMCVVSSKSLSGVSPAKNEIHLKKGWMTPQLRECMQPMSAAHGRISFLLRSRPVQTWASAACFILHIWGIGSDTQSLWHTQTLTRVLTHTHTHARSRHLSRPFMYQWLHWWTCVSLQRLGLSPPLNILTLSFQQNIEGQPDSTCNESKGNTAFYIFLNLYLFKQIIHRPACTRQIHDTWVMLPPHHCCWKRHTEGNIPDRLSSLLVLERLWCQSLQQLHTFFSAWWPVMFKYFFSTSAGVPKNVAVFADEDG